MKPSPGTHVTRVLAIGLLAAAVAGACVAEDPPRKAARAASPPEVSSASPGAGDLPALRLSIVFAGVSFRRPVFVGHAGDGSNRLFVVEQPGRIKVLPDDPSASEAKVFLDIREIVHDRHNEEGLLSLAFHPGYRENGRFFVCHSADGPRRTVLAEYRVSSDDPDRADPATRRVILGVEQAWGNHNGATALFGPDGYLYLSLGDGGWAGDPLGSGQDLGTLLGAVLRLDVDRPEADRPYSIPPDNPFVDREGARGEIWASGLRNVWRMSFDRETGALWAGDVGQNAWEEIDLIVRGGNYGWNRREGLVPFGRRRAEDEGADEAFIDPVAVYGRSEGISVTGGYVYRGERFPALRGAYLYGDYVTGHIWALRYEDGAVTAQREAMEGIAGNYISSFGEDEAGEIYVCTFDKLDGKRSKGRIQRVVVK